MLRTSELQSIQKHHLDVLIPQWALLAEVFLDFKDILGGGIRRTARHCFEALGQHCSEAKGLFIRHWCLTERDGLAVLCDSSRFPRLWHLELSGCDYLAHTNACKIFLSHGQLRSLRATFSPKATVTAAFVEAAPASLMALGFVNFGTNVERLTALLARCPLEHLWFARTASFEPTMVAALAAAPHPLKTLSLPEAARLTPMPAQNITDEHVFGLLRECRGLELLHCWGAQPDQEAVDALGFELLAGTPGAPTLRRKGSGACLAPNGTLWAPYSETDVELVGMDI